MQDKSVCSVGRREKGKVGGGVLNTDRCAQKDAGLEDSGSQSCG